MYGLVVSVAVVAVLSVAFITILLVYYTIIGTGIAVVGGSSKDTSNHALRRVVVLKSEHCTHCRDLLPAVIAMQSRGVDIHIIDVLSTFSREWFTSNKVVGLPTICEMTGDSVTHMFTGRRSPQAIEQYVKDRMNAPR